MQHGVCCFAVCVPAFLGGGIGASKICVFLASTAFFDFQSDIALKLQVSRDKNQRKFTLPETNIAPENRASQKETSIPMSNHPFC